MNAIHRTGFSPAAACDKEPIHIPGSIQPHGMLIAFTSDNFLVDQISANCASFTGVKPEDVVGKPLSAVLGDEGAQWLIAEIANQNIIARPVYLGALKMPNGSFFDVMVHAWQGLVILEFEMISREKAADFRLLYPLITKFVSTLQDANEIESMCAIAAREIKNVTQFGRVLVYSFDHQGHGHVLAEAIDTGYHSYFNQRFPASDIPQQARAMYVANRVRLIANANYTPARLVPGTHSVTGEAIDLTYASLRSVSPVHLQYMRNMGTLASMSVSIVVKGRLWGLISCHNTEPREVSFETRSTCEQLGQILALHIDAHQERTESAYRLELRGMLVSLLGALSQSQNFVDNFSMVSHDLLRLAGASGAALIFEGKTTLFGATPPEADVYELAQWLATQMTGEVFNTDALSAVYAGGSAMKDVASGILALSISRHHKHYLIWFRPEVIRTIDWAGNPHLKSGQDGAFQALTPRQSFELWSETVVATSKPWRQSEIDAALEFRTAILGVVLERAEAMAELADELGRANKELESFSYSVSHDLRSPMRHIVGFTDLLLEMEAGRLSEKGTRFLRNIKESARFAGKLVDDLLSFSQMGRSALRTSEVDLNALVENSVSKLQSEITGRHIVWNIAPLPPICADPVFMQMAVQNLISNAVKYTSSRETAVISISARESERETVFEFKDNGVGFSMEYAHKLFGVFQRLHRMEDFEGTGIGLANVKRIVERHGGWVSALGEIDKGATFSFSVPRNLPTEEGDAHVKADTTR